MFSKIAVTAIILIAGLAGCKPQMPGNSVSTAVSVTLRTATNSLLGNYLADGAGKTLYYFTHDTIGKSNALNGTIQQWPIFYTANVVVPPALSKDDFASIIRTDGARQTTYLGWPLYYYAKDKAPGEILGEGIGGTWYIVKDPFYTIMLMNKPGVATYLASNKGMTLYWTTNDSVGVSNIEGDDLYTWPPFNPQSIMIPSSLNILDFNAIMRADFTPQLCYKGWPLYSYIGDNVSGDTLGQGIDGAWFAVNVSAAGPSAANVTTPAINQPANGIN